MSGGRRNKSRGVTGGRAKQAKSRPKKVRPFAVPDLRVTFTHAQGDQVVNGVKINDGALITSVGMVQLDDGRTVAFPGPNVVRFNLLEAREHQVRSVRLRHEVLAGLSAGSGEIYHVGRADRFFDFLSSSTSAVLMSFGAIEGLVNFLIDSMGEGSQITVDRKGAPVVYEKSEMVRRLSISEKLDLVVPMATGHDSIKGTAVWERYVHLRRLRDDLVHVKSTGYAGEPVDPQVYGRLLRGDADEAVQDAARLIQAIAPEWLIESVPRRLGIDS